MSPQTGIKLTIHPSILQMTVGLSDDTEIVNIFSRPPPATQLTGRCPSAADQSLHQGQHVTHDLVFFGGVDNHLYSIPITIP